MEDFADSADFECWPYFDCCSIALVDSSYFAAAADVGSECFADFALVAADFAPGCSVVHAVVENLPLDDLPDELVALVALVGLAFFAGFVVSAEEQVCTAFH